MSTNSLIVRFKAITLSQMDSVKLMNRTDQKYWFRKDLLVDLLEEIVNDYYILEIEGERNMAYSTTYYDTIDNEMYRNHHRGKLNRYKIRRRNYVSTSSSFLEVKFKSNKGRTVKLRQQSDYGSMAFDESDQIFIENNSPYSAVDLNKSLENRFKRLMLVSKSMDERCTIDSELKFSNGSREEELGDLVIVEVKRDGRSPSKIVDALCKLRVKPSGFSKYCMGRSLVTAELIQNNFKQKHRVIYKKVNNPINERRL